MIMIVDSLPVTVTYRPAQAFTGRFEVFGTVFCDDGTYSNVVVLFSVFLRTGSVLCGRSHTYMNKKPAANEPKELLTESLQ